MSSPSASVVPAPSPGIGRLVEYCDRLTRPIAFIGVAGMLTAAGVTVVDVLFRWLLNSGVTGLNEITAMAFFVAVAACVPSGMARGVSLAVDVVEPLLARRTATVSRAIGATLLFLFLAVLAWRIGVFAHLLISDGRTTVLLSIPFMPFVAAAAALLGLGAVVQLVVCLGEWSKVPSAALSGRGETSPVMRAFSTAVAALWIAIAAVLIVCLFDFGAAQSWANNNVSLTVSISLILMWLLLLSLVPLSAVMGLLGLIGCALFLGFRPSYGAMVSQVFGFLSDYQMAALPLFLLMGSFCAVSGVAEDLYRLAHVVFGSFRGGLAMATIGGCAGFGTVTGSSLATVATFGQVALPEMRARGYAPSLSVGCIAAGGTLGALIPPSGALLLYALLTETSIGQLFMAAFVPGAVAVALYVLAVLFAVRLNPSIVPARAQRERGELLAALVRCGPVTLLFGAVIGGLYTGVFTATEAASVGAFGGFLVALLRGRLKPASFGRVMAETTASTAMIYTLIFGVLTFSFFVDISQMPAQILTMVSNLDVPPLGVICMIILVFLFLGCVMDSQTVMVISVPIVTPIISHLGYDLVWWGIINLIVVEIGLITPPFGLHLFVLRSLAPGVSIGEVYRGVLPFCAADFLKLALLILFPMIALWLPSTMIR